MNPWWYIVIYFVVLGVTYRLCITRLASNTYSDRLECIRCKWEIEHGRKDSCNDHREVLAGSEIWMSLLVSFLWPVVLGCFLVYQIVARLIFFPTGKVRSREKHEWDRHVKTIKTEAEYEAAKKAYKELKRHEP